MHEVVRGSSTTEGNTGLLLCCCVGAAELGGVRRGEEFSLVGIVGRIVVDLPGHPGFAGFNELVPLFGGGDEDASGEDGFGSNGDHGLFRDREIAAGSFALRIFHHVDVLGNPFCICVEGTHFFGDVNELDGGEPSAAEA